MRCSFPLTAMLFCSELIEGPEQRCIKDTACKQAIKTLTATQLANGQQNSPNLHDPA